jgi:hypothetical protein
MRAGPALVAVGRHVGGVGLQALLVAAIVATAALALSAVYRPAGFVAGLGDVDAGRPSVSISFASSARSGDGWPTAGSVVYFEVGTGSVKARDVPKLWVANKCRQGGDVVYAQYEPVHDGLAGPFAWSFDGAASCVAYVWMFPNSESPLRGGSMEYAAY